MTQLRHKLEELNLSFGNIKVSFSRNKVDGFDYYTAKVFERRGESQIFLFSEPINRESIADFVGWTVERVNESKIKHLNKTISDVLGTLNPFIHLEAEPADGIYPYYRVTKKTKDFRSFESLMMYFYDKGIPAAVAEEKGWYAIWLWGEELPTSKKELPNREKLPSNIVQEVNNFNNSYRAWKERVKGRVKNSKGKSHNRSKKQDYSMEA